MIFRRRRIRSFTLPIVAAMVATVLLPGAGLTGSTPTLTSSTVQSGLSHPWDIAFTPDQRMVVTTRSGVVRIYSSPSAGGILRGSFLLGHVHAAGEAGLMGVAIDPAFAENRYIYFCVSRDDLGSWRNQVLRYRLEANNKIYFSRYVLRTGIKANTIHNGCALEFIGLKLFVTMGDAGNAANAQNRNSLNGKILRVNNDGSVPADNPIINGVRDAVYTMGHRNPQGIAVLPGAGRIYAIEHGPDRDDEINRIVPGKNYGWPCYTGNGNPYQTSGCGPASSYSRPAWWSGFPTLATSNGVFMTGTAWGSWSGNLFVSTLKERDIRRFVEAGIGNMDLAQTLFNGTFGRIRAAVRGPYGRLYITTDNGSGDRVIWIAPAT